MGWTFDRGVLLGLGLVVALLVANAGLSYWNTRHLNEDAWWVAHTHEVLDLTDEVLLALVDAETGQRGFLLTGNDEFLQPYEAARARLDGCLTRLKDRTADNPSQQERLRKLQEMTARKLALLREGIDLRRQHADEAQVLRVVRAGKAQMDPLRALVADMRQEEQALLQERQGQSHRAYTIAITTGLLTDLLALAMVGAFILLLRRSLRARQKAAAVLHQQRELYRITLESIGDGVITTDPGGRVLSLNLVAQALTGWRQDEAAGQPLESVFRIINEQTRQPAEDPASRSLREGTIIGLANHTLLIARDGTERPIDDSAAPIRNEEGAVAGVVLVFRDVTERRRAERALRESEERLRLFVQHTPAAVAMFDRDMRYLLFSRRWLTDFNLGAADLTGRSHYEVFPDLPQRWKEVHRRCLAGAVEKCEEDRFVGPNGQEEWLRWEVHPWRDERGEVGGVIIFSEVITERKRAERALRESEEQFRLLADSIPQLAWTARPDGHIFWYNQRWYEYTGTTPEQMAGWGWQSVHDPAELPRVLANWRAALASGQPWEDTFPLRRQDGEMRWHLSRALPLKDERGQVVRWFGTNTDITERRQMEEALREADRRKDEFLAMLAHELRNPLAPIRNSLYILKQPGASATALERAREMMERQVSHMARLLDDLLDMSRISRGRIELRNEEVDVASLMTRTAEAVSPLLEQRRHELTVCLPPAPVQVRGDPTRLEQVLTNLLNNAAKYTDPGGHIWLSGERKGHEVVLRVRDNGIGIAPEVLPRVFDLFVQAERPLDRSQGGIGIGLTLVRKLVELHGGTVEAHSTGVHQGAEFVVRLPCSTGVQEGRVLPAADGSATAAAPPSRRVLVVDDNRDAADSLAMLLRLAGQDVRVAYDGPSALAQAQDFEPDLAFLDIGMPGMDGYELASRLRQQPRLRRVLLVAVTGWGQDEDRRRSREAGFDRHLVKPAAPETLHQLLADGPGPAAGKAIPGG